MRLAERAGAAGGHFAQRSPQNLRAAAHPVTLRRRARRGGRNEFVTSLTAPQTRSRLSATARSPVDENSFGVCVVAFVQAPSRKVTSCDSLLEFSWPLSSL
jgi:hypothetical protein